MSQKSPRKTLYWNPDNDRLMEAIAQDYGASMSQMNLNPTQTDQATGEEVPNASAIVRYALMMLAGSCKSLKPYK